jgi:hypothetical protein
MKRAILCLAFVLAACGENSGATSGTGATAPAASSAAPSASAPPSASAAPSAEPSAATSTTPSADTSASAAPSSSSGPAPSASTAQGGDKKWSCGGKNEDGTAQKACPMQGWMKGVMARAMSGGDKDKIAQALSTIASKPPPGYGNWSSIAAEGASKAAAGDIEGAKASCKSCHAQYQKRYKDTMRDAPW